LSFDIFAHKVFEDAINNATENEYLYVSDCLIESRSVFNLWLENAFKSLNGLSINKIMLNLKHSRKFA